MVAQGSLKPYVNVRIILGGLIIDLKLKNNERYNTVRDLAPTSN